MKDIDIKSTSLSDTVLIHPRIITRDYNIEMTDIENLQSAIRYFAVLSDLTATYRPSAMIQEGRPDSMGSFMTPMDASSLSTSVRSFGMSRESTGAHLAVYIWLADGRHQLFRYDVTDQIKQAPDSMNVLIRVKGRSLPEIRTGEGGGPEGGGGYRGRRLGHHRHRNMMQALQDDGVCRQ